MADKPIIFSAPMVRALLAGRKTQTRRVLKPQPIGTPEFYLPMSDEDAFWATFDEDERCTRLRLRYAPGDRLWVRETWQTGTSDDGPQISYRATPDYFKIDAWDGEDFGVGPSFNEGRCPGATFSHWLPDVLADDGPWRSPIHMPRWASRLTLTVTDVRVQRLWDVSEADAVAEGCRSSGETWQEGPPRIPARYIYQSLWNSLHGPGAWEANPWVAAYSFTVQRGNIDEIKEPSND